MTGSPVTISITSHRLLVVAVTAIAALVAVIVPTSAAAAANTDYEQVVEITFPFEEAAAVHYRDDYDASRGGGRHHQATDLMVRLGTPVHAAVGGTVGWMSGDPITGAASYGWMVRITGDDGRSYAYVHLGEQDGPWSEAYADGIVPGARVERGQLLGWAGCSGSATCGGGEHLHLEIHDERVRDPYDYHDHERINPYWSLLAAEERGDYPYGGRFRDVSTSSRHLSDIEALADSGITKGCGDDRFCPSAGVTRQQMASFLTRGVPLPASELPHGFRDVPPSNRHDTDIAALAASGVTKGCGASSFCPAEPVTRQQMASFLVRSLDLPPAGHSQFSDVSRNNRHAADIAALAAAGITKGCGGDRFCPDDVVTREQMASFLARALHL